MKLIIDIPEEMYKNIKDGMWCGNNITSNAIENGIPLDKIRAEIDGIEINGQVDEHTAFIRTGEQVKQMTLNTIDKYTKGEQE